MACDLVHRLGLSGSILEPGLSLLRDAILSLSAAFYGKQHRQKAITNRGYVAYGNVLRQLNAHLAQAQMQTTNETIMTAVTCMIFEISVSAGSDNFLKHVQGIEAILAARGPPTSPTGADPAMLSGVRILCIFGALAQRRPSVWATDGWSSVPPLHSDEGSVIRHEILLILVDCTMLTTAPKPSSFKVSTSRYHCPTISRARELLNRLEALYARWEQYNVTMLGEDVSSSFKDPAIANPASMATYMLYQAAYICVLRILKTNKSSVENTQLGQLEVAASLRIVTCLEPKAHDLREGSGESNTIVFIATKIAGETLGGFNSSGGRRLSRTVKAAANGVFAVGAWDAPEELLASFGNPEGVAPLLQEHAVMSSTCYKAIDPSLLEKSIL